MYEAVIINNGEEKVINAITTDKESPRIEGQIKEGVNAISSFTFQISEKNAEYNNIYPFATLVKVFDTKKQKYAFEGRVLTQTRSMEENGFCQKEYVCEGEMGYLVDSVQEYESLSVPTDVYFKKLLEVHNKQVEEYKKIYPGIISENLIITKERVINYESTWKNINDNLIAKYGGELRLRKDDGKSYLDYLSETGENSSVEIRLAHNLKSMNEETSFEGFYTRIVPLGTKLKEKDESGNEMESGKRLGITEINDGKNYVQDDELVEKYGIITGFLIDDDITIAAHLITKAQKELVNQRLTVSNTLNAYDLYYLGLDMDNFEVGNRHLVTNEKLDMSYQARIIEKTTDINNPIESSITIGDTAADAKSIYENKVKEAVKKIENVLNSLDETTRNNIKNAINNATNKITGANGGYVLLDTEYTDGSITKNMPWRILVMDTDDKNTAKNIIQINKNGIGFSKNGINGPYTNAWTIDGQLVADFITAGKIQAGVLSSSVIQTVWNGITDYIKIQGGELQTYDAANKLVSSLNRYGQYFYNSGKMIGKIGTNSFETQPDVKGLVFDLEEDAGYMCWAAKEAAAGNYIVRLVYYNNNKISNEGLHFSCDTFPHGNLKYSTEVTSQEYTDNSAGIYSATKGFSVNTIDSRLQADSTTFSVTKNRFTMYNSADKLFDCYNDIDMHSYSILNQSDARLKKNIEETDLNALDIIQNIELKKYDWIETNEHVQCGIIAQQLQKVYPEAVVDAQGILSLKMEKFIMLLLKAVQELAGKKQKHTWKDCYNDARKYRFTQRHKTIKTAENKMKEKENPVMIVPGKEEMNVRG